MREQMDGCSWYFANLLEPTSDRYGLMSPLLSQTLRSSVMDLTRPPSTLPSGRVVPILQHADRNDEHDELTPVWKVLDFYVSWAYTSSYTNSSHE